MGLGIIDHVLLFVVPGPGPIYDARNQTTNVTINVDVSSGVVEQWSRKIERSMALRGHFFREFEEDPFFRLVAKIQLL